MPAASRAAALYRTGVAARDAGAPKGASARRIFAARVSDVDLARTRDLLIGIAEHFLPLRQPAGHARNREQHREDAGREAHGLIDQTGVEVDVRVELALD